MNPDIPKHTRKLLQRLTKTGSQLEYHSDTKDWFLLQPGHAAERLIHGQEGAAKDALKNCLLQTTRISEPIYWYELTNEAVSYLLQPGYVPRILRPATTSKT